jgi:hypothetical protein
MTKEQEQELDEALFGTTEVDEFEEEVEVESKEEEVKEKSNPEEDERLKELSEKEELTEDEVEELKKAGYDLDLEEKENEEEAEEEEPEVDTSSTFDGLLERIDPSTKYESREEKEKAILEFAEKQIEGNQVLVEVLENNPDLVTVIKALKEEGKTFKEAIQEVIDLTEIEPEPGDDGYKEYIAAQLRKEDAKKAEKERRIKFQENQQKSAIEAKAWAKENNLSDEQAYDVLNEIDMIINDFNEGKVSKELLNRLYVAKTHKQKLESEVKKAEIKAKNEKIFIRKSKSKDVLPNLSGAQRSLQKKIVDDDNVIPDSVVFQPSSFAELAKRRSN